MSEPLLPLQLRLVHGLPHGALPHLLLPQVEVLGADAGDRLHPGREAAIQHDQGP